MKREIVERSVELFKRVGCKRVTMDDVALSNGISKRTLYELFESKDALLEESLLFMQQEMAEAVERYKKLDLNIIEIVCKIHKDHAEQDFTWKNSFLNELKRYHYGVYKNLTANLLSFHRFMINDFIERGKREGIIREEINVQIFVDLLMEISAFGEKRQLTFLGGYSRKEIFREVVLSYIRGLCTELGVAEIEKNVNS
ncbi:MAG: TetR/AcrR family transcriptional regulator [Bacteroidales bacterium]